MRIIEGAKSLALTLDSAFNKGKGYHEIFPPSYEEMLEHQETQEQTQSKFITNVWWKSE